MIRLTLKSSGKPFLIREDLIVSVTEGDEDTRIVWIDLKEKVGYEVTESLNTIWRSIDQ